MTAKLEKNTEAFLAVLTLVIGADDVGSLEERDFLFKKVSALPLFGNPSKGDFMKLLGEVTDAVYQKVPQQDGAFTSTGIDALLAEVRGKLDAGTRKTLVATATELGAADGADAKEDALLEKIRRALG